MSVKATECRVSGRKGGSERWQRTRTPQHGWVAHLASSRHSWRSAARSCRPPPLWLTTPPGATSSVRAAVEVGTVVGATVGETPNPVGQHSQRLNHRRRLVAKRRCRRPRSQRLQSRAKTRRSPIRGWVGLAGRARFERLRQRLLNQAAVIAPVVCFGGPVSLIVQRCQGFRFPVGSTRRGQPNATPRTGDSSCAHRAGGPARGVAAIGPTIGAARIESGLRDLTVIDGTRVCSIRRRISTTCIATC